MSPLAVDVGALTVEVCFRATAVGLSIDALPVGPLIGAAEAPILTEPRWDLPLTWGDAAPAADWTAPPATSSIDVNIATHGAKRIRCTCTNRHAAPPGTRDYVLREWPSR